MKKVAIGFAALVLGSMTLLSPTKGSAASSEVIIQPKLSIEVLVNARKVQFPDSKPQMVNNTVLIPLRFVSDKLNVKLSLSGKAITMVKGDKTVKLTIGAKTASVNGKTITLGAAASATNGRTMVPLRFISEAFGEVVEWDNLNQFVWIGNKEIPDAEDLGKKEDMKSYLHYYGDQDFFLDTFTDKGKIRLSTAKVLSSRDLPFKMGKQIYYRLDLANTNRGEKYIRVSSTDFTNIGVLLVCLADDNSARSRLSTLRFKEGNKSINIQYNPITSRTDEIQINKKDWENFKPSNIDFLQITGGTSYALLFKPDWSE
ncbi:copper amine oxidase N-terminal domain-containing protein [Paenibacillus sp. D51F]